MAKPVKREEKKQYSKPRLTVYGTVKDLTQSVNAMHHLDGGHMVGFRKTA